MKAHQAIFALAAMCRVLGLSTSGYNDWLRRTPSVRARSGHALKRKIMQIWNKSDEIYGCPRTHAAMGYEALVSFEGQPCSPK